jgi:hypothetical protein
MKISVFWVVALCSLVDVYQRFRGHTASVIRAILSMKISVFWVVALFSLVDVNQRFKGHTAMNRPDNGGSMTSETLVNIYHTTRRNNPEDIYLHRYYVFN